MADKTDVEQRELNALYHESYAVEMSVEEARELIGQTGCDELDSALDEAQGRVKTTAAERAYVVIRVR